MTALTADRTPVDNYMRGTIYAQGRAAIVTSETVFVGSGLVRRTTTGRVKAAGILTAASWRAFAICVGFYSDANGNNETAGVGDTGGTVYAKYKIPEQYLVTIATAIRTQTALGTQVIWADDNVVGGTATGTNTGLNQIIAGNLWAFDENASTAKSKGWLQVGNVGMGAKITI